MESYGSSRIVRGGTFIGTASANPAGKRVNLGGTTGAAKLNTFRVALYIK